MSNPYSAPKGGSKPVALESADTWLPGSHSSRLFAVFIDLLVVGVLWLPVLLLVDRFASGDLVAIASLVGVALVYGTLTEASGLRGTLGFKLAGLRVLQKDGSNLSFGRAFLRTLLRILLGSLGLPWGLIGLTPGRRALWDFPAGAYVVGKTRAVHVESFIAKSTLNNEID